MTRARHRRTCGGLAVLRDTRADLGDQIVRGPAVDTVSRLDGSLGQGYGKIRLPTPVGA